MRPIIRRYDGRVAAPAHRRQDRPRHVLQRDVHVGHEARLARHQLQHRVVERLRVRVEKADPRKGRPGEQRLDEARQPVAPRAEVLAVARRVLRDQDELRDALRLEAPRLGDERLDRAAPLEAPHLRNRAEGARVVAPLADLEVRVAPAAREHPRRELVVEPRRQRLVREPRQRRQARRGRRRVLELVEADEGVHLGDLLRELAAVLLHHAARDDDAVDLAALLALDLLEDRLDRLFLGAVDEAAGVDEHDARLAVRNDLVAGLLQVPEHHLGVHEVLRAAEGHDADGREGLRGHGRA